MCNWHHVAELCRRIVTGDPTGWQAWLTAYTPTGKTAQTTDPLGHATRTAYDALDRPIRTIAASGRVTGKTHDLAGEEITQRLRIGSPNGVGRGRSRSVLYKSQGSATISIADFRVVSKVRRVVVRVSPATAE